MLGFSYRLKINDYFDGEVVCSGMFLVLLLRTATIKIYLSSLAGSSSVEHHREGVCPSTTAWRQWPRRSSVVLKRRRVVLRNTARNRLSCNNRILMMSCQLRDHNHHTPVIDCRRGSEVHVSIER